MYLHDSDLLSLKECIQPLPGPEEEYNGPVQRNVTRGSQSTDKSKEGKDNQLLWVKWDI